MVQLQNCIPPQKFKMPKLIIVTLCIAIVSAKIENLELNSSVEPGNVEFSARVDAVGAFSILAWHGCYIWSVDADFEANKENGEVTDASAEFEAVAGAVYTALNLPPIASLASLTVNAEYQPAEDGSAASLDTETSRSFAANAFWSLEEVNPADEVVREILLKNTGLYLGGMVWDLTDADNGKTDPALKSCEFTGKLSADGEFKVVATFVKSEVVGELGISLVTPNSIEAFLEIENFPLEDDANRVRLVMIAGMGESLETRGYRAAEQIETPGEAYFNVQSTAIIDGEETDVGAILFTEIELDGAFGNGNVEVQLTGQYGATATVNKITVDFTPGATNIVYDPSLGVGPAPTGGARGVTTTMALMAIVATIWAL